MRVHFWLTERLEFAHDSGGQREDKEELIELKTFGQR